jgi:hypothetical protein
MGERLPRVCSGHVEHERLEPHTEDPKLAHQELYFVAAGRATFTIDRADSLLRSDPARAREILAEGIEAHPESASLHYNMACLEAVQGNRETALAALRTAVELKPEVAEWARDDDDFESVRDDPGFRALTALP